MDAVLRFLAESGAMLLAGVTALLGLGCVGAAACRSPAHRQRVCEVALVAAVGWAVLACIPLPRLGWGAAAPPTERRGAAGRSSLVVSGEIPPELIARPVAVAAPEGGAHPWNVEPAARRAANVRGWAAVAYLSGSVACAAWLAIGYFVLRRVIRHAEPAPADVRERAGSCAGGRRVSVLVSRHVTDPVTFGVWRPVILLPAGLLAGGREAQLQPVLRHEVSHVLRRDGWGNLLFCLALPALYVHPCYWCLRRWAEMARELVADDWAARADGREAYATALVALARSCTGGGAGSVAGGIGILQRRSAFYWRMRMLLQRTEPLATGCSTRWRATVAGAALIFVVGTAAMLGVRPAVAQVPPPTPPPVVPPAPEQPAARPEAPPRDDATPPEPADQRQAVTEARKRLADLHARRKQLQAELDNATAEVDALEKRSQEFRGKGDASDPYASRGQPGAAGVNAPRPDAAASPGAGPGSTVGGVQLDLVNLANSLVDASGAYKQAVIAFDAKERLSRSGGGMGSVEVATARTQMETARKRVELLRSIAQVAMESARLNCARLKQLSAMGMVDSQAFDDAAAKVKMLEVILKGAE